jgi:type VI secretion system protein ImpK
MPRDDTFFGAGDGDRTVLKPTPGRRRGGAPPSPEPRATPRVDAGELRAARGANALVDAAGPLLVLAAQLRDTASHPDPGGLCEHVAREVEAFEAAARNTGVTPEALLAARYALCTFLDEIVLSTPWGSESAWARQSLLLRFHKEGWGGEKFFQILERVSKEPARSRDLLELMYLCLSLGFEGKYKVQDRGSSAVERVREDLYTLLRAQRGARERELSPHWRGIEDVRSRLARYVPLWVFGAIAGAVLLVVYGGFLVALHTQAAPVRDEVEKRGRNIESIVTRTAPPPPVTNLRGFLAPEIQQRLVEVEEKPGETRVRLTGSGLFGSGSAVLAQDRLPLLKRIAEALNSVPGSVLVTGHTDSDPVSGGMRLKFADNWELSKARAEAVRDVLARDVTSSRLEAEGRADTEPLVPNDSAANKARNRRVEILLLPRAPSN